MKKFTKRFTALLLVCLTATLLMSAFACPALAEEVQEAAPAAEMTTSAKALSAAIAIGLAAGLGALAMGTAIAKSSEAISRQPSIRTTLMLGLVFVETAIIYALIVAILVIFVL